MLAKQVQTELAQANSVADEALATMTTVRAHAADDSARAAYAVKLAKFYSLQASLIASNDVTHCTCRHTVVACCCPFLSHAGDPHCMEGLLLPLMHISLQQQFLPLICASGSLYTDSG